jgi:hypothetical protein
MVWAFVVIIACLFCLYETGSHYVAQAGLELSPSSCLSLPNTGITDVYHHTWLYYLFIY